MTAKDDLAAEGKRQLGNTLWSYEQSLGERENYLALARKDVAPRRLLDIFWSTASSLLKIGQGRFRLEGDTEGARAAFRQLELWSPFFAETVEMATRHNVPPMDPSVLIEPLVCLALGGSDALLLEVAEAAASRVFAMPRAPKQMLVASGFALDLAACVRPTGASVGHFSTPLPPEEMLFHGYDRLFQPLVDRDSAAFNAACGALESSFVRRGRQRNKGLNWYGSGKLAQATCFDALGTAMMRMAHLRGLIVEGDSPLYPRAFIG